MMNDGRTNRTVKPRRERKHLLAPAPRWSPAEVKRIIQVWGAVVIVSSLLAVVHLVRGLPGLGVFYIYWPTLLVPEWLHSWIPGGASCVLMFLFLWVPYTGFLHLGLFLAIWKWKPWWLLLEVATLASVAGTFPLVEGSL